jgi:hypothetical protein
MLLAGVAVVLAIGAGLGAYFALRGSSVSELPKAQQSAILERAKAEGVIDGYRVRGSGYEVVGGRVSLRSVHFCHPDSAGPCYQRWPLIQIEYRHTAKEEALAISRIAQARMPNAKIQSFEVTNLGG